MFAGLKSFKLSFTEVFNYGKIKNRNPDSLQDFFYFHL